MGPSIPNVEMHIQLAKMLSEVQYSRCKHYSPGKAASSVFERLSRIGFGRGLRQFKLLLLKHLAKSTINAGV